MPSWSSAPAAGGSRPIGGDGHRERARGPCRPVRSARRSGGPAGDVDRVGEPVEPVGGEHDVGGLGRRGRTSWPPWRPRRGRGQGGRVVEPVADHHGDGLPPLGAHGVHLARRGLSGAHLVEAQHLADLPRRLRAVSGEHDQPGDPGLAQPTQGPCGVACAPVAKQDRPDRCRGRPRPTSARTRRDRLGSTARLAHAASGVASRLPTRTWTPSTVASTPRPGSSCTSCGRDRRRPRVRASATTASRQDVRGELIR